MPDVNENLSKTISALEIRIAALEKMLTGPSVTLKAGQSSLTLNASRVDITSTEIRLQAARLIEVKANGDLILKGSTIREN